MSDVTSGALSRQHPTDGAQDLPREQPQTLLDRRPWGMFERFTLNERSTVKIITVDPGQRLSLQSHTSRSEWWTALDAGLTVDIGGRSWEPAVGEQVWIAQGTAHRASNRGSAPVRFAFGHFDEDDIERLHDDYAR